MKKFYMVKRFDEKNKDQYPSSRIHYDYETAYNEAIRLSKLSVDSKFCIMEFTGIYVYSTIETVVENINLINNGE